MTDTHKTPEERGEAFARRIDALFKEHDVSPEGQEQMYTLVKEVVAMHKGQGPATEDEPAQESGDAEAEDEHEGVRFEVLTGPEKADGDMVVRVSATTILERLERLRKFLEIILSASEAPNYSTNPSESEERTSYALGHLYDELRLLHVELAAYFSETGESSKEAFAKLLDYEGTPYCEYRFMRAFY